MQQPAPRGPRPIRDVLQAFLRESGLRSGPRTDEVFEAWLGVVGEGLARHARPVRFQRGELTVEVDSAAHLQELKGFTGEGFRTKANAELGSTRIRRVVYRLRG